MNTSLCLTAIVLVCGATFGASSEAGGSVAALGAGGCDAEWLSTFGGLAGTDMGVSSTVVFDDGNGPALYVGGWFSTAGQVAASRIARWDGKSWSALGSGLNREVLALAVFDDGSGPALYAGGRFTTAGGLPANHIAKWDGAAWSPVGLGVTGYPEPAVHALTVYDDGGGPVLVAGGLFASAGAVPANCVAQWNGTAWSAVGGGLDPTVHALEVHDAGGGPRLYAGGEFTGGGGTALARIARWDGTSWSTLGAGMNGSVLALLSFDDGSGGGPALFAGGSFSTAGGVNANRIAKWNGTSWSALAAGLSGGSLPEVYGMSAFDDGSGGGQALFATGTFTNSGGSSMNTIARWDGAGWSALSSGVLGNIGRALEVYDDGGGDALYMGGGFTSIGGVTAKNVARWDGSSWSDLGRDGAPHARTETVVEFDDGTGPALYAGGFFTAAGGVPVSRVARWNGNKWSPLGSGIDGIISALATFDDGGGTALYAGGGFTTAGGVPARCIAKWDGASWSALGSGIDAILAPAVGAMHAFDDGSGPALYVGGYFQSAGGLPASHIARWDGTSWSALGAGLNYWVTSLVSFDDGSGGGPALYAGGAFYSSAGAPVSYVAKWDGTSWSQVGGGVNNRVQALAVYDDGNGAALYAGGYFTQAGGVIAPLIARWDGNSWSPLPGGPNPVSGAYVNSLAVFDSGSGPQLFAGGDFPIVGGVNAQNIARWDGASWHVMDGGVNDIIESMGVADVGIGQGPALYIAGQFTDSPSGDPYLTRWGCTEPALGYSYCSGDGGGTPCPCGNAGGASAGCANSTGVGATLAAVGSVSVSADDLEFRGTGLPDFQPALLFLGNDEANGGSGVVFGDGLRCVALGLRRLTMTNADVSGQARWGPGLASLGGWNAGDTRRFQAWYRDPVGGPCGTNFNLSNGFGVTFAP